MIAFRLRVPRSAEEALVTVLWELDTLGIETQDDAGGSTTLLAYFPAARPAAALVEAITHAVPDATIEPTPVPEVDWVAKVREGFRPFDVAGFRVLPEWEAAGERAANVLIVDPGRAFGLGTHESTQLCLDLLRHAADAAPLGLVLDVGSGTGILSVAALRLNARRAVACDIDPEAVAATRRHAVLNHASIDVVMADGAQAFVAGACDTLLANVTAPMLIERAPELVGAFRRRAILAGLLEADVPTVAAAFRHADPSPTIAVRGEWAGIALEKR